ncbi:FecR domain-containing protein [Paraglaciecola sp. 20A4]|uniref:FecR family protein n=1 Tax=Paraglaciecola sp. 20A4 TaxID=2687288 RepID=UPI0014090245|nr:FecR domain-containing protein [Paraglaciecola sp. 20A4]
MTQVVKFPNDKERIKREASEWIARMEQDELTALDKTELNTWLAISPEHEKQLKRLAQLWDKMSEIGERSSSQEQSSEKQEKRTFFSHRFAQLSYKTAAFAALVLAIPIIFYLQGSLENTSKNGQYFTKIGEQKNIILTDGSELLLNTNSIVEVNYSRKQRNITLFQGEANFGVAPDKSRPFTVKAGTGDVRALGTNFSVRLDGNLVNVLVSHGTVRVRAKENIDGPFQADKTAYQDKNEVIVGAGNNVVFDDVKVESVEQESDKSIAKKLYWRKGFLSFDDEPLSDVIAELSRYTNLNIVIADKSIQAMKVGGFYPIDNLETVFTTLELNLGLNVNKMSGGYYYITNPNS